VGNEGDKDFNLLGGSGALAEKVVEKKNSPPEAVRCKSSGESKV